MGGEGTLELQPPSYIEALEREEAAEAVEDDDARIDCSPSGDWVLTDSQYAQVIHMPQAKIMYGT